MSGGRTPVVEAYWQAFCVRHGVEADQRHDVFAFGSSAEQADRLLALVLHGRKRATAGRYENFDPDEEPVPVIGASSALLDGPGNPAAVIRTTGVDVQPMNEVDEALAWDEGEGGRSLAHRSMIMFGDPPAGRSTTTCP